MIALLQRVTSAAVEIDGKQVAKISTGLLVLFAVQRNDSAKQADRLLQRLLAYRVFEDENGRMNRSVTDVEGELLLVPQFTLAADTGSGNRPSFTAAADPVEGKRWFDYFVGNLRVCHSKVQTGVFGADMQVSLTNDGPVTFWLEVLPD